MTVNWITIHVSDMEKSKEFYGDYLGLKKVKEFSPNESMSITFFEADNGMQIELIHSKDSVDKESNNSGISIGICTKDFDTLLQQARERKILTQEPMVLGGNMECFFVTDPNGVGIQLINWNAK